MEPIQQSSPLVTVMLIGWFPVVVGLFALLPPRRAVLVGFLAAWLFLPIAEFEFRLVPEINKMTVTSLSVLLGVVLFDLNRLINFRPRWLDIPIALFCVAPMFSSLANGLGFYDGASEMLRQVLRWGFPYFIGRLYFTDLRGARELAVAVFIAGLIYVPLCLYEVRMSPQLHRMLYGYHQHEFFQHVRFGGWRPMVFMSHGLMVGAFMMAAALCGFWLWLTKAMKQVAGIPLPFFIAALFLTTVMVKSVAAIVLLFAGVVILTAVHYARNSIPITAAATITVFYLLLRATGLWSGAGMVDVVEPILGERRAASLEFRLENERNLSQRAREQPLFGWGGWGRARVHDPTGRDISVTDSLWIITLGNNGFFGLAALVAAVLLPALLLRRRIPPSLWTHPAAAPTAVLAVLLVLWMVDNLLNAMVNPVYLLAAGGLAGMVKVRAARRAPLRTTRTRRGFVQQTAEVPQP